MSVPLSSSAWQRAMSRTKSCVRSVAPRTAPATTGSTTEGQAAGELRCPGAAVAAERVTPGSATGRRPRTCGGPEGHRSSTMYPISSRPLRTCGRCRCSSTGSPRRTRRTQAVMSVPSCPSSPASSTSSACCWPRSRSASSPSEVCPSCEGNDDLCAICGGAGWVPRGGRHGADATAVKVPPTGPASKSLPAAKVQRARSSGNIETPGAKEPLASPISANHDDHMVDQTVGNNTEKKTLKRAGNRAGAQGHPPEGGDPSRRKASRARRSAAASHRTAPSTKAKTNKKKAK